MIETWRPESKGRAYEVSDAGRVRRSRGGQGATAGRVLRPLVQRGYFAVTLGDQGVQEHCYVHLLVSSAFLGPRPEGMEVNHRDGNKLNNHVWNLEYVSHLGNARHAKDRGLWTPHYGEDNGKHKLTVEQVKQIREDYLSGETQTSIAIRFKIQQPAVWKIVSQRTWKGIK